MLCALLTTEPSQRIDDTEAVGLTVVGEVDTFTYLWVLPYSFI